jgi:hypothetical protein
MMTTKTRRFLIAAPWLSLPLLLGSFYLLWDRLPAALAVQFDTSGNPTNSMRKGVALALDAAILLLILLKYSLRLRGGERPVSAYAFIIYYVVVAFVTAVFLLILRANV